MAACTGLSDAPPPGADADAPARLAPGYAEKLARGERVPLPLARMLVPDGYEVPADGRVPLFVHFQGGVEAAAENFARMQRPGVLIASTLAGRSSAFAEPYRDPAQAKELLRQGEAALAARAGRPVQFAPIVVTFWSAGYGAVREWLKDDELYDRIQVLVSADSIYASVVAPAVRAPRIEQLIDFVRFAQAAALGSKTFVLAHGRYQTDYASTAETAALLRAAVAAVPQPSAAATERGVRIASECHVGGFHVYEFAEVTPGIHVDCLYFVPEMVRRHVPEADAVLRVVSWNIHHGAGRDDVVDQERIAAELRRLRPDVVCLQEVDVGVRRSGGIDLPRVLAASLGMHAAFGKNIDHQGGDYGNAILSRWPIEPVRNVHYAMLRDGEQRGLLLVRVRTPLGAFGIGCTHLDFRADDAERVNNTTAIAAARQQGALDILAGDFNDRPGSAVHALLTTDFVDAWPIAGLGNGATFPSDAPDRRIDWLLSPRDGVLRPVAARVAATAASDHCPLVVDYVTRPAR